MRERPRDERAKGRFVGLRHGDFQRLVGARLVGLRLPGTPFAEIPLQLVFERDEWELLVVVR